MINLRQIEAFRAVMIHKTVTRAAQTLHVSQPAVSRLISDLEYYVGFALFKRHKGRLIPTPEAQALFEDVDRAFVGLDKITDTAREIREFRTGRLLLSCMPALALGALPSVVEKFSVRHPGVTISLQAHSSQRVLEWVATQQCDAGLIGMRLEDPSVTIEPIACGTLRLVMLPGHRLARKETVTIQDLEAESFVSLGQAQDVRPIIDEVFRDSGIKRRMRIETQLSSVACELVLSGAGVSLIDPVTADCYSRRGLVSRPFTPEIPFHYSAVLPAFRPPSRLALEFLEEVRLDLEKRLSPQPHNIHG
ncbi:MULTISPECIES: LysR substrate-binding domain-containing protein [Halomonadaceae]|uniref:LysR substrate-binding domain-containing protein n=1 Tax=Halomonadaceae TaxID=28256 RepID=UPI0015977D16|nr:MULTISPECIES: LysR substrate-binding domain-containing protein [Halomonas]QJQ95877.1 LysR family transcriptional regulator [Halomonas sp. PA5]